MQISEEILEKIKSQNDIVDVISERVRLKKAGRNFTGLCPFHNEKTPSFSVSQEKQIYKCFGCGDVYKRQIMTRMPNIIYGSPDDSAYSLAKKIIEHEIDSIPIVEKSCDSDDGKFNLKIVGKISKTNITKLFVNLGEAK